MEFVESPIMKKTTSKRLPEKLFEYFFHDNCIFGGMCENKVSIEFSNN